jgi:uncharacterized protein with GYD domain
MRAGTASRTRRVSHAKLCDLAELDRSGCQEQPRHPQARTQAFDAAIQNRRGKVREHLYTLGEYDIVMVAEFPDDESAVAAVLHLGELGNVRTKTVRAFTNQEAGAIISLLG